LVFEINTHSFLGNRMFSDGLSETRDHAGRIFTDDY
jgi:hypothetical protein